MMDDEEFKELVKICVDKFKDKTILELIENDTQYQMTAELEGNAEAAYMALDLSPEQRAVCDNFIECRGQQEYEYHTFAYIAGLRDACRIARLFFPEKHKENKA